MIEDLNSSNGTYVNGRRIDRATPLRPGDSVGFGSQTFVFREASDTGPPLVASPELGATALLPEAQPERPTRVSWLPALAQEVTHFFARPFQYAMLLVQAPLVAALIVAIVNVRNWVTEGPHGKTLESQSLASVLSWLTLSAIWFGLSDVILARLLATDGSRGDHQSDGVSRLLSRLIVFSTFGVAQCAITWFIVSTAAGLTGSALHSIFLLVLAMNVGLALGMLISTLTRRAALRALMLVLTMIVMWGLGGERWPLPRLDHSTAILANVVPSRWAFEGLILLDSDWRSEHPEGTNELRAKLSAGSGAQSSSREFDLAETFFPLESERMGLRADTIALVAMAIGAWAFAIFVAAEPRTAAASAEASRYKRS